MPTQLNGSLGNQLLLNCILSKNKAEVEILFFFDMHVVIGKKTLIVF